MIFIDWKTASLQDIQLVFQAVILVCRSERTNANWYGSITLGIGSNWASCSYKHDVSCIQSFQYYFIYTTVGVAYTWVSVQFPCKRIGDVTLASEGKRPTLLCMQGVTVSWGRGRICGLFIFIQVQKFEEPNLPTFSSKYANHSYYCRCVVVIKMSADWNPEGVDPSCYIFSAEWR